MRKFEKQQIDKCQTRNQKLYELESLQALTLCLAELSTCPTVA
jgi:hypothetical protein